MLSVRVSNSTIVHMYNCERDSTWSGPASTNRSRVVESQEVLFPKNRGFYEVIRFDCIRVTYRNRRCETKAHILRREPAWCAQTCFDLFDGQALHQRGVRVKI